MTARIPAALPDHHEDRTSYTYSLQTHAHYWKTYQIRLKSLLPDPRLAPISTLHEPNSLSHQSLADKRQGGDLRGLPRPLTGVAIRLIEARLGVDLNRFDWVERAGSLSRPMFIVASSSDTYVPSGPSRALARARPDLVTYLDVPGADHTRGWNVDPERYQAALGGWLTARRI
jgi:fermentation-respiration switch protein FrsA (DUF1100 family)